MLFYDSLLKFCSVFEDKCKAVVGMIHSKNEVELQSISKQNPINKSFFLGKITW